MYVHACAPSLCRARRLEIADTELCAWSRGEGGRKRRRSRIESANCSMEQLAERLLASLTTISVRALGAGGIPNCLCVCGWCCTLSACTGTTITGAMDFCGEGIFLRGKGDLTVTNFARASVFHFAKCN